ncbi:MAG: putative NRPS-like protein biosynthetic cluster [Chrysothrix sp. TS-e1954]|nr:MAG: putative NRPS-like protein biosynthetic cluster [Chrysothrix sp. TS-e1954]
MEEDAETDFEPHPTISIFQVDFGAAASVSDVLRRAVKTLPGSPTQPSTSPSIVLEIENSQSGTLPINTSLVWREDENQDRSAADRLGVLDCTQSGFQESKIVVDVAVSKHDLFGEINYKRSILSTRSASNVASVYAMAITEILSDPHRLPDGINLLTKRDLAQIRMWNRSFPQKTNACVHDLLLHHASCSPQSPALCSWDGNVTYHELDDLTFRVACRFVRAGIKPKTFVPICFRKSIYAIIAMIAVHRAGGAFVPLDPSHPKDRIKAIIQRTQARFVVASSETASLFHDINSTVIEVSSPTPGFSDSRDEDALPVVRPDYAAFVLFTSGSTGQPKGIVQEHASVCTNSLAHGHSMQVTSDSRVFQYAAFTFDVSMMDVFTTLIYGGCVCIPSEEERMGSFTSAMNKMHVNWVLFTPSVASLITPEVVPTLQTLAFGGEAVKQEDITRWYGRVRLFNCYGPAECGACSIGEISQANSRPANIGRQYGSGLCWVVNPEDHDRILPIGATGELLVGGPTLARGYLDDLEKTQAAFIKSPPWSQAVGINMPRRIYKTGDLVRQNSNGSFDFIGRKDLQLKVRGQRVELGEVEHHLSAFAGIALAMAAMPKSGPYSQILIGLIQLQLSGNSSMRSATLNHISHEQLLASKFDEEKILQSLKDKLPCYMVPTHLVIVNKLPLSVSGKIDRKAVDAWLESTSRVYESKIVCKREEQGLLPKGNAIALDVSSKILSMTTQSGSEFLNSIDGSNFLLSAVGLDSIKIINLTMFIRQKFGVRVQLETVVDPRSTVMSVTNTIETLLSGGECHSREPKVNVMEVFRMYQQQTLERVSRRNRKKKNVFMTGATGFLGSRILHQLCAQTDVHKIVVHVRSKNPDHAWRRIRNSAMSAGWCPDGDFPKLEAWSGDLATPRLGLNPNQWRRLCGYGHPSERITTMIHNGATVDWNASWSSLKASNVDSTIELLNAASHSASLSDFIYVSGGQQLRVGQDDDLDIAEEVSQFNGYAQTKFLSELMVKEYASTTAPSHQLVSVVKPGYIMGTATEGIANADDFIWRLTASCINIKAYNAGEADSWLFISDVRRVAVAVVDCCCSLKDRAPPGSASIVKILDGITVSRFWNTLVTELGYELYPLQTDLWMERIAIDIEVKGDKHPLWPLLHTIERFQGKLGSQCDPRGVADIDELGIVATVKRNIQYLTSIGYIPKSDKGTALPKDGMSL